MTLLRPELPPLPAQMAHLPVVRGYPVPWFVAWVDDDGVQVPAGQGTPDFRLMSEGKPELARAYALCWVCGLPLVPPGALYWQPPYAFVVGPMCAVNRTSAEPPSHVACADWSARACPFLTRPHAKRREKGIPENAHDPAGIALKRNPGVALVWVTRTASARLDPDGGMLFDIGEPLRTRWYAEGRPATRAEILDSIESGLPILEAEARKQRGGKKALALAVKTAYDLIPETDLHNYAGVAAAVPPEAR